MFVIQTQGEAGQTKNCSRSVTWSAAAKSCFVGKYKKKQFHVN